MMPLRQFQPAAAAATAVATVSVAVARVGVVFARRGAWTVKSLVSSCCEYEDFEESGVGTRFV